MTRQRKKNRTHLKGPQEEEDTGPKSFVIKSGDVTGSVAQLVRDMRKVMEPGTASRLKERQAARLRDYLVMASPLGVTHMLMFSLTTSANLHLRVARLPSGPTMTFRVERYSLMKDLLNASLRNLGKAPGGEYQTPPLLVMNNFQQPAGHPPKPQLKLMSTLFQGLFPPIQVEKSALPSFRRVLLISYHPESNLISLRHYTIVVRPHGVSRRVRRILNSTTGPELGSTSSASRSKVNLSSAEDIADYLLRNKRASSSNPSEAGSAFTEGTTTTNYDSETDASEAESDSNAVDLPEDYVGRGNKKGERRAVRLVETGPRLELRLVKVVEGLVGSKRGEGETVFHEFVAKTKKESAAQKDAHNARRKIKEERRKAQEANVAKKKAEAAAAAKAKKAASGEDAEEDGEEGEGEEEEEEEDDIPEDVEGFSEDEDEFAYEDRFGGGGGGRGAGENDIDEDDEEFDEEAEAGDVSEEEEVDSEEDGESEEEEARPVKRVKKSRK